MLSSVGFRCRREFTNQFEGRQRQGKVYYDYVEGKKLLLDITNAHPFAKQYIKKGFMNACKLRSSRTKEGKEYKILAKIFRFHLSLSSIYYRGVGSLR